MVSVMQGMYHGFKKIVLTMNHKKAKVSLYDNKNLRHIKVLTLMCTFEIDLIKKYNQL